MLNSLQAHGAPISNHAHGQKVMHRSKITSHATVRPTRVADLDSIIHPLSRRVFQINRDGIASIAFNVGQRGNTTKITLIRKNERNQDFFHEQQRIANAFGATIFQSNAVIIDHGLNLANAFRSFEKVVHTLKLRINEEYTTKMLREIKEMQTEVENKQRGTPEVKREDEDAPNALEAFH